MIVKQRIASGLNTGMDIVKRNVITTITTGERTGRPYRLKINGKVYQGRHSAPNEPIANITGRTANETYTQINGMEAILGSQAPYSGRPEYGTRRIIARKTYEKQVNKDIDTVSEKIITKLTEK